MPPKPSGCTTFSFATHLVPNNITGLGKRFSFGTEYLNTSLAAPFNLRHLLVTPQTNPSATRLDYRNNQLQIFLGPDYVLAGTSCPRQTNLVFLPLNNQEPPEWLRSDEKQQALTNLFKELLPANFSTDTRLGTLQFSY